MSRKDSPGHSFLVSRPSSENSSYHGQYMMRHRNTLEKKNMNYESLPLKGFGDIFKHSCYFTKLKSSMPNRVINVKAYKPHPELCCYDCVNEHSIHVVTSQ